MSAQKKYYETVSQKLIKELESRNMEGYFCATKEDALKLALDIIPKNSSISWGGSQSIKEIGLIDAVKSGDYTVYDRADAKDMNENQEIMRKAYFCDYYLASTNAITLDGKLVNIDGNGNRVSAMIFGPQNVLLIVGMNKLTANEAEAVSRIRNYASVLNTIRLDCDTPCKTLGFCANCKTAGCICCHTVTTSFSRQKGRIKIILVGEELGY